MCIILALFVRILISDVLLNINLVSRSIQHFRQRSLLITFLCHQVSYFQLQWFRSNCHYRKANIVSEKVTLTQVLCLSKVFSPHKVPRCHSHCATPIWEMCMAVTLVDVCSCCHFYLGRFYKRHVLMKIGPSLE
jgi:hypothetical protein